jgi:primosomal protein N' (replication factor Y)
MAGKAQIFSNRLKELIFDRLQKAEQVILFLNRRGFATQMMCSKCGYVATCDNCSVSYVYHKHAGTLSCHMCGAEIPAPTVCPQCGDPEIRYSGFGTEKIETITQALFPKAKIARMDSDTMRTKDCYKKVLEEFRAGRVNILIGTQMIAKGLDFPNVTLVGVVQADIGLHIPDFRSGERVFQLITQVAGRAGRGDTPGKVVVQTYTPDHFALRTAVRQDFHAFYEEEAPSRKMLDFPPCSHMVMVHFRSQEEALAAAAAEAFTEELKPWLEEKTQVIGPMPAPLSKVQKFFRYQLLLRGGNIRRLSRLLRSMIVVRKQPKNVAIYADVDPRNLL